MELGSFGKILIVIGIITVLIGLLFMFGSKIPFVGRLPGDIAIQKKNFGFYFPITTCIVISIIISFILWLFGRK